MATGMGKQARSVRPFVRDIGDRPASVREVAALYIEIAALKDRVESLTGLVARRLGIDPEGDGGA